MMSKSGPGTMPTGFPLARTKMNSRGSARRTTKNIMRKLYLYGYGTCNFYRDAVKLATSAKSKGLIELECKRFIDSASYFEWLSKNKGVMFDDAKSRTEGRPRNKSHNMDRIRGGREEARWGVLNCTLT